MSIDQLLATYPRIRPPLSAAHQEIFVEEYKINRGGEGLLYSLIKFLESWHHKQVAKLKGPKSVLELGAGTINHIPYEPDTEIYDCIEPFHELYEDSPNLSKVRRIYDVIEDVPKETRYQRIISIGVLEHLVDLPAILARSGLLLTTDGIFQSSIPSEGGFLWGISWRLSTGIAYKLRTGLEYKPIMRHEHINNAHEILKISRFFFNNVNIKRFPLPSHHLSFYTYIEASAPNLDRCIEFLDEHRPEIKTRKDSACLPSSEDF